MLLDTAGSLNSPDPLTLSLSKRRRNAGVAALILLAFVPGCNREKPQPAPSDAAVVPSATATAAAPELTAAPSAAASKAPPALDTGALNDREDPDRLLRYYAAALGARDWAAAAKAWGEGSGVTAKTLKESYDRAEAPQLTVGKGISEGAAGSLYYEVPAMLRFGSGLPEHGSLVLRRVNDVDGATAEQLRWHIERSTIGQGQ